MVTGLRTPGIASPLQKPYLTRSNKDTIVFRLRLTCIRVWWGVFTLILNRIPLLQDQENRLSRPGNRIGLASVVRRDGDTTTWTALPNIYLDTEYINFNPSSPSSRAGKNRNRCFFIVEKNMFVTPVFYLGAERNRFTIAPQHRSCELVNLFSRRLPGKPGLVSISVARGCLKHLFLSKSSQTTL